MTKSEQIMLRDFCKEVLNLLENPKPNSWFQSGVGLCTNYLLYKRLRNVEGKSLSKLVGWKSKYPWGNYNWTKEDLYANPKRIAFLKSWANKN